MYKNMYILIERTNLRLHRPAESLRLETPCR